jgi:cyclophilin family peptidyl-prolyl cis-trans isomerase/HEAT repeat protein
MFDWCLPSKFSLWPLCSLCLCGFLWGGGAKVEAQQEAAAEQLAPLLAAEDARDFRSELFRRALVAPDSLVRRVAAMAAGRIGDLQATPLLQPLLADPDSTVRVSAAFALGLLRDTIAAPWLMDRLTGLPALDAMTAQEAATALAKIGGPRVGGFFADVLSGSTVLSLDDRASVQSQMILESWRLGRDAPARALLPFLEDTNVSVRSRAVYALARLRAPEAAERLILVLRDQDPYPRALAARALTRAYVESAKLAAKTVAQLLARVTSDPNPPVRINALHALGDYHDSTLASQLTPLLSDPVPNVQVEAAQTLGQLGGAEAAKGLVGVVKGKGAFAVRRAALVALSQVDRSAFETAAAFWRNNRDWRFRSAAAEGSVMAGSTSQPWFLRDPDGRVIAAGLQQWASSSKAPVPGLLSAARSLLAHPDAGVRSVAADVIAGAADLSDLPALSSAYRRAARDSFPDAALSALNAILAIRKKGPTAQEQVDHDFLQSTQPPADYLLRRWAEDNWPEATRRWGPAYPIVTGRTLQDYRDVAQQFLIPPDSLTRPHVIIQTEQRGPIEIELLGSDAPLTVANFLRLVDRHFFDGNRWHRVVPNFVVQDGDPRGDGFGSPGGSIRDEVNRNRYDGAMLGMALSGPDTGSSQWFITLSPQPHLDGTYTVFGRVVGSFAALNHITQGDLILTVKRAGGVAVGR